MIFTATKIEYVNKTFKQQWNYYELRCAEWSFSPVMTQNIW